MSWRTLQRWAAQYRPLGLTGLARAPRPDKAQRRLHPDLQLLIEGLALRRPPPTIATIARQVAEVADEQGWAAPGYTTVRDIVQGIDPAMVTLARKAGVVAQS